MEKTCKRCNQKKDISLFAINKTCKNGRTNECKKCKYEFYRNYPSIENVSEIDRTAPIKCPICGSEITDNFTRIVGFLVSTKNWHKTRREIDFPNRQWYGDKVLESNK